MNKGVIVGVAFVVMGIVFAAGFFVDRLLFRSDVLAHSILVDKLHADLEKTRAERDDLAKEQDSKVWIDEVTADAIKPRGYNHAFVIRWRNCIPDASVELDERDGPKRIALGDVKETIRLIETNGKRAVAKGSHGCLIVTLRWDGKSADFDCEVSLDIRVSTGDGSIGNSNKRTGKMKVKTNSFSWFLSGGNLAVIERRNDDGSTVPWIEVKLIDPAR